VRAFHYDAVSLARLLGLDFLSMPEHRCADHSFMRFLQSRYGARILAASRRAQYAKTGQRATTHGGVLCMGLTSSERSTNMRRITSDHRGFMSNTLELPGYKPAALITIYVPGPRSPQVGWVDGILASVAAEHRALSARFGHRNVFIACDANRRLHDHRGRHTHDGPPGSAPDALLARLCDELDVSPLHGRTEDTRAHVTSRCIDSSRQLHDEQGTEVDYILGSNRLQPDSFSVLPNVPFSSDGAITHRLIAVSISLEPAAAAVNQPEPAAARTGPPPVRAPRAPDYDDIELWSNSLDCLMRAVQSPEFAALRNDPTSDLYTALSSVLSRVQHEAWAPASAERAARDELLADPLRHVSAHGTRVRNAHRLYRGRRLPPPIAGKMAASRKLINRATKLRTQARGALQRSHRARAQSLLTQADVLGRQSAALRKEARAEAKNHAKQWSNGVMGVLLHRRLHNQADLWRQLNNMAPSDPLSVDVGGPGIPKSDESFKRFTGFFESLYTAAPNRAPLSGPTGTSWDPFIPTADGSALGAAPTAEELYRVVFPAHKRVAPCPTSCTSGVKHCVICATELASYDAWDGDPDNTDAAPLQSPVVHTSTAAGPDGILAEVLRFSRTEDPTKRHAHRMELCGVLADVFGRWHAAGAVPASACEFRSTPLYKDGDPADPVNYRFLTIGGLLQKVWCVAMTRRLTHWAVGSGILSETQAAFIPQHGCEQHVYTLTESIRWNWQQGRDVSTLFIDLRKAYDLVRADSLYPLLRKMGVSQDLVRLLESRSSQRTSRVRVNGVDGPPVRMEDGVGQGDPLSCIVFNLFMEPLLRSLDSLPGTNGITVGPTASPATSGHRAPVRYSVLAFADDLACPVTSPDEIQLILDHVLRWCQAWGMELGVKKTQAVHFPRPARPTQLVSPPALPPLSITWRGAASPIEWAASYRYLGFVMHGDLRVWGLRAPGSGRKGALVGGMGFMNEVSQRANAAYRRIIESHTLIRKSPPALALQVFRTAVAGCINFLMCLMEPTASVLQPLDRLSLKVAREATRLKSNCPNFLAWAESRLLHSEAVLARERSRFLLQLQLSPLPGLAQRVYAELLPAHVPAGNLKRAAPGRLWTYRMLDLQAHYAAVGAPPAVVSSTHDMPAHVALRPVFGRPVLVPSVIATQFGPRVAFALASPISQAWAYIPPSVVTITHDARSPVAMLDGAPLLGSQRRAPLYIDIKRAANVHGRGVGLILWHRELAARERAAALKAKVPASSLAHTSDVRPRPGPPALHSADLLQLGFTGIAGLIAAVGTRKTITPLSCRPGSGGVLALASRIMPSRNLYSLGMLRQGRQAMFLYPLAPACRMVPPRPTKAQPRRRQRSDSIPSLGTDTESTDSEVSVSDASSDLQLRVVTDSDSETGTDSSSDSGTDSTATTAAPTAPRAPPSAIQRTVSALPAPCRGPPRQRQPPPSAPTRRVTPPVESAALVAWRRASNDREATCTLCGGGPEDPLHVLSECTHPAVAAVRSCVISPLALARKIVWICEVALAASSTPGQSPGQQAASKAAAAQLVSELVAVFGVTSDGTLVEGAPPPDWASAEMRTVLFRFLAVLPFPASAAAPGHGVVRLLGTVFDRVTAKAHKLRPVANAWVGFAGAAVSSIFHAWNAAFDALRLERGG